MNYPLNTDDIHRMLKTNIINYKNLKNVKKIDDILLDGTCFILYETKERSGHWCCVVLDKKTTPNTLIFFDPYSGKIDTDQKKYISNDFVVPENYLSNLFKKSKYNLEYNEHPYQQLKSGISTCGRHCIIRCLCKNLNTKQYDNLIKNYCQKSGLNPDQLVLSLTSEILGK
jgi:hypothetical protein